MRDDDNSHKNSEEQYEHGWQGGLDVCPTPRPLAVTGLLAVAGHACDLLVRAQALSSSCLLYRDLLRPTAGRCGPWTSQCDCGGRQASFTMSHCLCSSSLLPPNSRPSQLADIGTVSSTVIPSLHSGASPFTLWQKC